LPDDYGTNPQAKPSVSLAGGRYEYSIEPQEISQSRKALLEGLKQDFSVNQSDPEVQAHFSKSVTERIDERRALSPQARLSDNQNPTYVDFGRMTMSIDQLETRKVMESGGFIDDSRKKTFMHELRKFFATDINDKDIAEDSFQDACALTNQSLVLDLTQSLRMQMHPFPGIESSTLVLDGDSIALNGSFSPILDAGGNQVARRWVGSYRQAIRGVDVRIDGKKQSEFYSVDSEKSYLESRIEVEIRAPADRNSKSSVTLTSTKTTRHMEGDFALSDQWR
jgi:hypothetical protein